MSRTIDKSEGVENLSDEDLQYLWDRDDPDVSAQLLRERGIEPYGVGHPMNQSSATAAQYYAEMPDFGNANTTGRTSPDEPLTDEQLQPKAENLTKPQLRGEDDEEDDEDEVDYNTWTNEELRAELVSRELSVSGNKTEMVSRLEADDAEEEDDEE